MQLGWGVLRCRGARPRGAGWRGEWWCCDLQAFWGLIEGFPLHIPIYIEFANKKVEYQKQNTKCGKQIRKKRTAQYIKKSKTKNIAEGKSNDLRCDQSALSLIRFFVRIFNVFVCFYFHRRHKQKVKLVSWLFCFEYAVWWRIFDYIMGG